VLEHEHIHKALMMIENKEASHQFDNVTFSLDRDMPLELARQILRNQQECDEANIKTARISGVFHHE
jgi:hypothetical protein